MFLERYQNWYRRTDVAFEMVKQLSARETSLLSAETFIRCLKIHNIHFLAENFERYKFYDSLYNVYRSVAVLKDFPMCSFAIGQKKEQQLYLVEHFQEYVTGYDFVIDIDGHDSFEQALTEARWLKEVFDDFSVPYALIFSGSGFHFEVPSQFTDLVEPTVLEKPKTFLYIARTLKSLMMLTHLDSEIYDLRRVWKIAYTLDYKTGRIALPLSDEQFEKFTLEMVQPDNIGSVQNRGLLTRNIEHGAENFKKFVDVVVYGVEKEEPAITSEVVA